MRHGEAVAVGIALDASYCHRKGMLADADRDRILVVLEALGFELSPPALATLDIEAALDDFRVHLGGELCVCLLDGIGRGVDVGVIDVGEMASCVDVLRRRS